MKPFSVLSLLVLLVLLATVASADLTSGTVPTPQAAIATGIEALTAPSVKEFLQNTCAKALAGHSLTHEMELIKKIMTHIQSMKKSDEREKIVTLLNTLLSTYGADSSSFLDLCEGQTLAILIESLKEAAASLNTYVGANKDLVKQIEEEKQLVLDIGSQCENKVASCMQQLADDNRMRNVNDVRSEDEILANVKYLNDARKEVPVPTEAPQNPEKISQNGWWMSQGRLVANTVVDTANRPQAVTYQQAESLAPPKVWTYTPLSSVQITSAGVKCTWAEVHPLYLFTYIWIPKTGNVIAKITADDIGWVFLNGAILFRDAGNSMKEFDVSEHKALKRGAWNAVYAIVVNSCGTGVLALDIKDFFETKYADATVEVKMPAQPPANQSLVQVKDTWYQAVGPTIVYGKKLANGTEAMRVSPAGRWTPGNRLIDHGVDCNGGEVQSLYLFGWVWVPKTGTFYLHVSTDDRSWVYVNEEFIFEDGCCGNRVHDLSSISQVKRGAWNKVLAVDANLCGFGSLGVGVSQ